MKSGFIIYAIGLVALSCSDLLVSRFFSPGEIADWALFRSLVGIAAVVPLIGLDQVLVRNPAASGQLLRLLTVQIPPLGLAVGVLLQQAGLLEHWWIGTGLAIGAAGSLVLFQYFRSHHRPVLSQLSQQGWRIAVFALVAVMTITGWRSDLLPLGVALILLFDLLMVCALLVLPPGKLHPQKSSLARTHYAIGSRFMFTGLLLALSVYAEQLVVNRLGTSDEAALYFTSATYFLFSLSFFNGYVAFLLGPWIRDRHDWFIAQLKARWWAFLTISAGYAVTLNLIGWVLWQLVSPSVGAVDRGLQLMFLWAGFARTIYVLPSGYLGVFGMPRQHDVLILLQILTVLPVIGLFFALRSGGADLVISVAAASALNWSLRAIVGFSMIGVVARMRAIKVP